MVKNGGFALDFFVSLGIQRTMPFAIYSKVYDYTCLLQNKNITRLERILEQTVTNYVTKNS